MKKETLAGYEVEYNKRYEYGKSKIVFKDYNDFSYKLNGLHFSEILHIVQDVPDSTGTDRAVMVYYVKAWTEGIS